MTAIFTCMYASIFACTAENNQLNNSKITTEFVVTSAETVWVSSNCNLLKMSKFPIPSQHIPEIMERCGNSGDAYLNAQL